ncbi:hypothetical protein [Myxosarcina sp. GI1]|uniref:hypothetical protein n=1 Tax=Myxosarcina sp. GI1 TaxID=1541065 RepID=UPI0005680ECB|nr:hypothetical protein [Myxosarcina sp. GI1]
MPENKSLETNPSEIEPQATETQLNDESILQSIKADRAQNKPDFEDKMLYGKYNFAIAADKAEEIFSGEAIKRAVARGLTIKDSQTKQPQVPLPKEAFRKRVSNTNKKGKDCYGIRKSIKDDVYIDTWIDKNN